MQLPCVAGKCAAQNAAKRLRGSTPIDPAERASLEAMARGCDGETRDPWDSALTWPECPAQAAGKRPDIRDARMLAGLASMSPLADWPHGWTARVVDTWALIEVERAELREAMRDA